MPFNDDLTWYDDPSEQDSPSTEVDKSKLYGNSEYTGGPDGFQADENQTDAETARLTRYLQDAQQSGLDGALLDKLSNAWNTGSKWVKDNKELTALLTGGVGSAMRQKNDREVMALRNQYQIDAENRMKDYQRELWQRKNDSITGMAPVSLGIIGKAMLDPHLEYLQSRKK